MKKLLLIVVIVIEILSCKGSEKGKYPPQNNNEMSLPVQETGEEITNENVYYLNVPGNMWIKASPGDNSIGGYGYIESVHKTKVIVLEEIEGWKKVDIFGWGLGFGFWVEDRYLVKNLGEIVPDYDFIRNAVGKYYYDRVEIVKQDYEDEPYIYDGNVITLNYENGDEFYIKEVQIVGDKEEYRNEYECNVPNNNTDPFMVGGVDGKKSFDYEYYFIEEGIKIRIKFRNFSKEDFIYDVIYKRKS